MKFTTSLEMDFLNLFIATRFRLHSLQKACGWRLKMPFLCFSDERLLEIFALTWSSMDASFLELKTAEAISIAHEAQLLNYLRATNLEVGLILNFGPKAQVRRLAYVNTRKRFKSQRTG